MSKFIEDFQWEWEYNGRVKAETVPEAIDLMKEAERLIVVEDENKELNKVVAMGVREHKRLTDQLKIAQQEIMRLRVLSERIYQRNAENVGK